MSIAGAKMMSFFFLFFIYLFWIQSLEDNYERTLQDEAKELEQLLSKRNLLLAKQEDYSKKIRELGPLSSDAFDTYYIFLNFDSLFMLHFFQFILIFADKYLRSEPYQFYFVFRFHIYCMWLSVGQHVCNYEK